MTDQSPPGGSVGEKIRGLLSARGMSQRQLAALLAATDGGASERQIENMRRQLSSWINDAHTPSPENAARIADALDVPADWLTDDQPRRSVPAALEELAGVLDVLTDHVEAEIERSGQAMRIVQGLDRRLAKLAEVQGQLLEGQMTAAAALEELLARDDASPGRQKGQESSS